MLKKMSNLVTLSAGKERAFQENFFSYFPLTVQRTPRNRPFKHHLL
jgi:hypothetical protein